MRHLARAAATVAGALALLVGSLGAQERQRGDTARLEPVVVTGTRTPLSRAASPLAVTVLTGDQLRAQGVVRVADALAQVPGASLARSGSYGATTSLFLRGGERDYVKVLVDGVPVNDPGGDFDFANLTTDNVERIEVVRGPGSVLYGSDAVTGVVQVFTRSGGGGGRAVVEARGGTYATREGSGEVAGGAGALSFSAGGAVRRSDGVLALNNEYRSDALSGALRFAPSARGEARLTGRYTEGTFHFPTDFANAPTDSNQFTRERRVAAGLDVGYRLTPAVEARLLLADSRSALLFDNRPDSPGDTSDFYSRTNTERYRRSADLRLNSTVGRSVVTLGGVYEAERESNAGRSAFGTSPLPDVRYASRRLNRAAYAQIVRALPAGATLAVGGRYDDNERFGAFRTGRAAVSAPLAAWVRVRGAAGSAFKEPAFGEVFDTPFTVGNRELRPERSRSYEGGVDATVLDALTLGATYFSQRFDNLIQYLGAADGGTNYVNVGAAKTAGVELELRARAYRDLRASASFTYLDTRVLDGGLDASGTFVTGERLLRRPTRTASATVDYRVWRLSSLALTANHVGSRSDRDFSAFPTRAVALPAYTTVDAALSLDVPLPSRAASAAITLRLENLFDREYQSVYGYDAPGRVALVGGRVGVGR